MGIVYITVGITNAITKVVPYASVYIVGTILNKNLARTTESVIFPKKSVHIRIRHGIGFRFGRHNSNSNWTFIALISPNKGTLRRNKTKSRHQNFCIQGHSRGQARRRTPGE